MKTIEQLQRERTDLSNRLYEIERLFFPFWDDRLLIEKLRSRAVGKDKQAVDASKWITVTYLRDVTVTDAEQFVRSYGVLTDVIARVGKTRAKKMQERLDAMHAMILHFLAKGPPLFAEVETWVNTLSIDGYKAMPAFSIEEFAKQLQWTQERETNGQMQLVRNKLDAVGFLSYIE